MIGQNRLQRFNSLALADTKIRGFLRRCGGRLARPQPPENAAQVEEAKRRTCTLAIWEGSAWSVMAGFGDTYISPFAIFLKASDQAIALLSTMPAIIGALAQMLGAAIVDRRGRRLPFVVGVVAAQALMFLFLFFIPVFFPSQATTSVILCAVAYVFLGNMGGPGWLSMMGDVVPESSRGDYFSRRSRYIITTTFLSIMAAGLLLSAFKKADLLWTGFGVLFVVACGARLLSAYLMSFYYDAPYRPARESYFSFWAFIRRTPKSNFAKYTFFVALMGGAVSVASPFFNVYMLRDMRWSYTEFTLNTAALLVTQFLLIRSWGRLADRHGNRAVLVATSCLFPVLPVVWCLTTNYFFLLGAQILAGIAWSGYNMATMNFILDAVSPQKRARALGYYSLVIGVFTVAGGMLGGYLATHLPSSYSAGAVHIVFISSLPAVFIMSGILRLVVALLLLPRIREVRPAVPISPGVLLLRLTGGEALAGTLWHIFERLQGPRVRTALPRRK